MTTAVIGLGTIGHKVARLLMQGGEDVIVATRHLDEAKRIADEIGAIAVNLDTAIVLTQAETTKAVADLT